MNPALPAALSAALETLAEGRSGRDLAARAQAISAAYRSGGGSAQAIRTDEDALAYALTRMPATYAAVGAALEGLAMRAPDFAPRTVTDVGCGPGTASWAALATFHGIQTVRLLDNNAALMGLAGRLLDEPDTPVVEKTFADMATAVIPKSDLVIAAYCVTELPEASALQVVERLWTASDGALVIVEPGTPTAWTRLMALRSMLINLGAAIAAPCPHPAPCPLAAPDWCHFCQRLPRSRAHRAAKGADAPFEDEKYAYLAVTRPGVALEPPAARVLAPPVEDKAAMSLKLCEPSGALTLRRVAKRDKEAYRAVRRAAWGDGV